MALIQEVKTAYSFKKQAALGTGVASTNDYWSFTRENRSVVLVPQRNSETDAGAMGAGLYATKVYKLNAIVNDTHEGVLSSELAAHAFAYGFGTAVKAGVGTTGGYSYTCTPVTDLEANLPTFSMLSGLRAGTGGEIFDNQHIGVAVEEIVMRLSSGIARTDSTLTMTMVGTGYYDDNAGIAIPTAVATHELNLGSATALTIVGIDYMSTYRVLNIEFGWKNNIKVNSNYRPGGTQQDGWYTMAVMRRGRPEPRLTFTVEVAAGSSEEATFKNQTEGAIDIKLEGAQLGTGPEKHMVRLQVPKSTLTIDSIGESDDVVTYNCSANFFDNGSDPICTATIYCMQNNVLVQAS